MDDWIKIVYINTRSILVDGFRSGSSQKWKFSLRESLMFKKWGAHLIIDDKRIQMLFSNLWVEAENLLCLASPLGLLLVLLLGLAPPFVLLLGLSKFCFSWWVYKTRFFCRKFQNSEFIRFFVVFEFFLGKKDNFTLANFLKPFKRTQNFKNSKNKGTTMSKILNTRNSVTIPIKYGQLY